jgi:endonuclease/exonuclease/phosphatase family metal-dependent hydrolase
MTKQFLFIILFLITYSLHAQVVKIMSYNIRFDNVSDGINQWKNRKEGLANLINQYNPDIIGTQEGLNHQIQDLDTLLPHYESFGVGRNDGVMQGEYVAIFYKKDRFKQIAGNHFWLCETPTIPGKTGWDAKDVRMVTWCALQDKRTGKTLYVFNTHFDHIGKKARMQSALLIKKMMDSIAGNSPVILTGDLNATRCNQATKILRNKKRKPALTDAGKKRKNKTATFSGFSATKKSGKIIDYILYSKPFTLIRYSVLEENNGTYYFSDHKPVLVELSE